MSLPAEIIIDSDIPSGELKRALASVPGLQTQEKPGAFRMDPVLLAAIIGASAQVLAAVIQGLFTMRGSNDKPVTIRLILEDGRAVPIPSGQTPEHLVAIVDEVAKLNPTRLQVSPTE